MYKKLVLALALLFVAMAVFCTPVAESAAEETQMKIVSLGPNITETIFALGKGDLLVGRTDYCDYPQEVASVPSIGDLYNPNIELIVSLRPDVVISSSIVSSEVVESLKNAGVEVVSINPQETLEGTYVLFEKVGEIVGASDAARALTLSVKERIKAIEELTASITPKKTVYYCVGYGEWGDYTATGDTFVSGILSAAGGDNIAKDGMYWMYSKEALVDKNPEVFLLPEYSYSYLEGDIDYLKATEPYSALASIKGDGIRVIDGNVMDRQGPRVADAVETVAKILYPELF